MCRHINRTVTGNLERYSLADHLPLYYMAKDYRILCPACASGEPDHWITHCEVNDLDVPIYCVGCNKIIDHV